MPNIVYVVIGTDETGENSRPVRVFSTEADAEKYTEDMNVGDASVVWGDRFSFGEVLFDA